ncbi:MAG: hypothetical protein ACOY71_11485 [Gemmatimonadota bacterium]
MSHLDEGTLMALLDGELGAVEADAARLHVRQCTACAERLSELQALSGEAARLLERLDGAGRMEIGTETRRRRRTDGLARRLALAATIALAVGAGYWWSELSHARPEVAETRARPVRLPPAPTESVSPLASERAAAPGASKTAARPGETRPERATTVAMPRSLAQTDSSAARGQIAALSAEAPAAADRAGAAPRVRADQLSDAEQRALDRGEQTVPTGAGGAARAPAANVGAGRAEGPASRLMLIAGLSPDRIDVTPGPPGETAPLVRVSYRLPDGRPLVLEQQATGRREPDTLVERTGRRTTIQWHKAGGVLIRLSADLEPDSLWTIARKIQ